jgi:hypothetical protein
MGSAIVKKFLNLKPWLTIADAARHLSILFGEDVSDADVLRLGLDGHPIRRQKTRLQSFFMLMTVQLPEAMVLLAGLARMPREDPLRR